MIEIFQCSRPPKDTKARVDVRDGAAGGEFHDETQQPAQRHLDQRFPVVLAAARTHDHVVAFVVAGKQVGDGVARVSPVGVVDDDRVIAGGQDAVLQ